MIREMNDQNSRDRMTPGKTTNFTSSEFTKEKRKTRDFEGRQNMTRGIILDP